MEQPFEPRFATTTAGLPLVPVRDGEDAGIRISQLDSWDAAGSTASEFCFFCLAVPTDDAVRAA
jgi:hypothetical protein